jgi:type I restriction enzyme S subunit
MRVNQAEQNPRPRYKPYGEYKDSGVEWMGEIPAHWEVKRIKHVATKIGSGKTPSGGAEVYLNEGIMLVRSQNVHFGGLRLDDVAFVDEATDREMANTRVLENDVLLNITGASLGRCCLARLAGRRANVNQHVCIIRPRQTQFDPSALSSALTSNALQAQIFNNENGISRDALNFVQIGNFAVCKPTLQEQQAITAFLDRETERIDGLVAKKERLIELLQEKRSALITRAVTKGLDPNVPMKDSGVEWLGEIPAHWEVFSLRRLIAGIEQGWSPVADDRVAGPDEWAVIKLSAVSKGKFLGDEHKALPAGLAPDRRFEIREGDFLLTRANTPEFVGEVCVARGVRSGLMLCDLVYRLNLVTERVVPEYLSFWLLSRAGRYQIEVDARGASQSMVKVSQGIIRAWTVVLPPIQEQRAITEFADRNAARLDALVAKVRTAIDRLRELRTALISAAVTGKIDVREEAP